MNLLTGPTEARLLSQRLAAPVATLAALKAIPAMRRNDGMRITVTAAPSAGGGNYRFSLASALANDDQLAVEPTAGAGCWLRETGAVDLAFPIAFGTADAAVLYAMPVGARLLVQEFWWEVTTSFAGGSSSAIGVSSNKTVPTSWVGKGDLLGGATGDVAATLVATAPDDIVAGTVGTDFDTIAKRRGAIWVATDNFIFDRITSAFTSGAGFVHVSGILLANNGA